MNILHIIVIAGLLVVLIPAIIELYWFYGPDKGHIPPTKEEKAMINLAAQEKVINFKHREWWSSQDDDDYDRVDYE